VLLSVFRIGQGLALGGSWDGLPSLLALNAPEPTAAAGTPCWASWARRSASSSPAALFAYLWGSLAATDFLDWGWRYPFYVAFAINVVALFARLRLVATDEYERLLEERELEPTSVRELVGSQGANILIGAFAALASYALFHLVTVFPLSWIMLYSTSRSAEFLVVQMIGAVLAAPACVASACWPTASAAATRWAAWRPRSPSFSLASRPRLLDGGDLGQDIFILVGFVLLGLSYGQAAGAVTSNFAAQVPLHRRGPDGRPGLADRRGLRAAGRPGLSAHFGLAYVSVYLLSGAVATLAALGLNRPPASIVERAFHVLGSLHEAVPHLPRWFPTAAAV
jgi:MFS family permease